MNPNKYDAFLEGVFTSSHVTELSSQIDALLQGLYTSGSFEDLLTRVVSYRFKTQLQEFCAKNGIRIEDTQRLTAVLEEVKEYLQEIPVVTLYLAVEPSEHMLSSIITWFRQQLGAQYLVKVEVDKTILAGVRIEFGGYWRDYSLSKKLEAVQYRQAEIHQE